MSTHTTTAHSHADHDHAHGWHGYLYILIALLILTVITVSASRVDFGSPTTNVVIAMTIATIKATLVALFFMHLKDDKPINGLIFVSTLLFLAVFLGFCLVDSESRWDTRPATYKGPVDKPALPAMDTDKPVEAPKPAAPAAAGEHGAHH
jgi:cytochrome c oxidase subunit 4